MKCIKSNKTGNIIRVSNQQADQTVGREWKFVSKSEWKNKIDNAPPLEYNGIEDINYLHNKLFAALKIPKAFDKVEKNETKA